MPQALHWERWRSIGAAANAALSWTERGDRRHVENLHLHFVNPLLL
jgi:hypothetical protein